MSFFSQLGATLFGVYLGIKLESSKRIEERKDLDSLRRKRLLEDIHLELVENKRKLDGKGHRMNMDIWDSGISSGLIQLLDSDQLRILSDLYHKVKGNLYEAKIHRQARETSDSIPCSETERLSFALTRYRGLDKQLKNVSQI
ncbi:MAG: hypothetical protein ACTSQH_09110 [Candidatus Hodarchaeales archaeon]